MIKQATAYQKFIRSTPRKLRLVADMVRMLPIPQALTQLEVSRTESAKHIRKVFLQAIANAKVIGLQTESLSTKALIIEEGTTLKRFRAVSRGRAHGILKHTGHIKLILEGNDQPKISSETTVKKGK